jgi:proline iminopeptidase
MPELTRRKFLAAGAAGLLVAARDRSAQPQREAPAARTGGSRRIAVVGGRYQVWTKEVGRGGIPVLTLHGGPGFNHFYLECFEDFLPPAGIRFWYYDQLGCGFSDQPQDTALWTLDRYLEEVEEARRGLELQRFLLYGHSWGALLGMEYALRHPQYLTGLVISNMTASVAAYVQHAAELLRALPAAAQATLARYREKGAYDAPEYQAVLMKELYHQHVCRLDPWPEPLERTFRMVNTTVYNTMQGPDEFTIVGNLKDWDIWDRLHLIRVPTLLISARYDEMAPSQIARMGTLIPQARVSALDNGSHFAMYDDQAAYFQALIAFIREVGAPSGSKTRKRPYNEECRTGTGRALTTAAMAP